MQKPWNDVSNAEHILYTYQLPDHDHARLSANRNLSLLCQAFSSTLKIFSLKSFVAARKLSRRRAKSYFRLIGICTGGETTGLGYQFRRAVCTSRVSRSQLTKRSGNSSSSTCLLLPCAISRWTYGICWLLNGCWSMGVARGRIAIEAGRCVVDWYGPTGNWGRIAIEAVRGTTRCRGLVCLR